MSEDWDTRGREQRGSAVGDDRGRHHFRPLFWWWWEGGEKKKKTEDIKQRRKKKKKKKRLVPQGSSQCSPALIYLSCFSMGLI